MSSSEEDAKLERLNLMEECEQLKKQLILAHYQVKQLERMVNSTSQLTLLKAAIRSRGVQRDHSADEIELEEEYEARRRKDNERI